MCGVIKRRKGRAEQDAYTASFGQGVATISGKCPLAGLFQLMVARILYDGLKPRLHTDTQQRLTSQRLSHKQLKPPTRYVGNRYRGVVITVIIVQ